MGKRVPGRRATKPAKRVLKPTEAAPAHPDRLVWRIADVDFDGEWSWAKLAAVDCARLHRELHELEGTKLATLKQKRSVKLVPLIDLTPKAQRRLRELGRDDPEGLWQLRLAHQKWRAWGFLENSVFYMLWWDPDHSVATGKSRTGQRTS